MNSTSMHRRAHPVLNGLERRAASPTVCPEPSASRSAAASQHRTSFVPARPGFHPTGPKARVPAKGQRWFGAAAIALTLALAGCASPPPPTPFHTPNLTLPSQAVVRSTDPAHPEEVTVSVTRQGQAQRWTARDAQGRILTQELLQSGQWTPVGGSPVATRYTQLFAVMLLAWTPRTELEFTYGPQAVRLVHFPNGDTRRILADCNGATVMQTTRQVAHPGQEQLEITDPAQSWVIGPVSDAVTTPISMP